MIPASASTLTEAQEVNEGPCRYCGERPAFTKTDGRRSPFERDATGKRLLWPLCAACWAAFYPPDLETR